MVKRRKKVGVGLQFYSQVNGGRGLASILKNSQRGLADKKPKSRYWVTESATHQVQLTQTKLSARQSRY